MESSLKSFKRSTEHGYKPTDKLYDMTTRDRLLLINAVKYQTELLIALRDKRKLRCCVQSFDNYYNMVLVNVKEVWYETPETADGKQGTPVRKTKFYSKKFLRGDSVILIIKNPLAKIVPL